MVAVFSVLLAYFYAGEAAAVAVTYTDAAVFNAALPGPATTIDFDAIPPGTVIPSGTSVGGVTFTYSLGSGVQLSVSDGSETGGATWATTSPPNFLSTTDAAALLDGDTLLLGFGATPALGLFIVSSEEIGTSLFDGDITLSAGGATAQLDVDAVQQTLPDGSRVFFLGVIDDTIDFSTASLVNTLPTGEHLFNLDDVILIPEPWAPLGQAAGIGLLLLLSRFRRSPGARRDR